MRGLLVALLLLACATSAQAGRSCEASALSVADLQRGLELAQRTAIELDRSGAQVVILARAGQDLTDYGLRYSHLGFALRQADQAAGPVWRVVHKLNRCGTAEASLYRQGLAEFFLDHLWRHEAAWVVPTQTVQRQLLARLGDPQQLTELHVRPYSIVSYAWGQRYQQSNQWVLETLAAALDPGIETRDQAQRWLRDNDYQPSTLRIGTLRRLGGRMTAANVAFDDHPSRRRFSGRIDTVTVDSVFDWLQRAGLAGIPVRIEL
ncbi:MAG: DUF2145 domain-containing protein [Xanthomonadales bacterium]|nr:DUF2145 domain-containing protein [Xanthomonadales bacterium]